MKFTLGQSFLFGARKVSQVTLYDESDDNLMSMPSPEINKPNIGDVCYVPDLTGKNIVFTWSDCEPDVQYFNDGLVHFDDESATEHKMFLIRIIKAVIK